MTTFNLPPGATEWLARGERGLSSNAIFEHLTGLPCNGSGWGPPSRNIPHDPADVRRCRQLLDAVPEFKLRFAEMAQCGPQWAKLVEHWERICALIDEERHTGHATKAYDLMQELLRDRPSRPRERSQ